MLIHIGWDRSIFLEDIVAIINIEDRDALEANENLLRTHSIDKSKLEKVKSLILVEEDREFYRLYKSNISSKSLVKRSEMKY